MPKGFQKGHKFLGDLTKSNYFKKGHIPWMKGKHHTEKTKLKNKLAHIGKGHPSNRKGLPLSEEIKKKMSEAHKKIGTPWLIGKKQSKELIEKRILKKENHWNWQGGKSFEEYPIDWTDDLKESIRKRDNFICYLCGIHQDELEEKLHIHHIDYDKNNLDPKNLISLCRSCHTKTNFNRNWWQQYFNELIWI